MRYLVLLVFTLAATIANTNPKESEVVPSFRTVL